MTLFIFPFPNFLKELLSTQVMASNFLFTPQLLLNYYLEVTLSYLRNFR